MDMTLSKRGDYVMRSAIALARAFERGESRKIREVVEETEVPRTFASQILADLVRADLASSKAGRDGGYRLRRSPSEISVLEVVEAAEGPLRAERCALGAGPCRWDEVCPLHETWSAATSALRDLLAATTLAEVAARDASLAEGTYAVPTDAHRSHPTVTAVADVVQVERGANEVVPLLERLGGRVAELVCSAYLAAPSAPAGTGRRLRPEGGLAATAAGEPGEALRFLLGWQLVDGERTRRFDGELVVSPVDDERCEVRLDGAWRQAGDGALSAAALERQAHGVARGFLRLLAGEVEGSSGVRRRPGGRPAPARGEAAPRRAAPAEATRG